MYRQNIVIVGVLNVAGCCLWGCRNSYLLYIFSRLCSGCNWCSGKGSCGRGNCGSSSYRSRGSICAWLIIKMPGVILTCREIGRGYIAGTAARCEHTYKCQCAKKTKKFSCFHD